MFYCRECADRNQWPKPEWLMSLGRCEVCEQGPMATFDVPSRALPLPPASPDPERL
jgi:hypothetical protein